MFKFAAGIAVAIVVHLLGWHRIESAIRTAGKASQDAYHTAETAVRESEVGK